GDGGAARDGQQPGGQRGVPRPGRLADDAAGPGDAGPRAETANAPVPGGAGGRAEAVRPGAAGGAAARPRRPAAAGSQGPGASSLRGPDGRQDVVPGREEGGVVA